MRGHNPQNSGWSTIWYIETLVDNQMFVVQAVVSVALSCKEIILDRSVLKRTVSNRGVNWTHCIFWMQAE